MRLEIVGLIAILGGLIIHAVGDRLHHKAIGLAITLAGIGVFIAFS